MKLKFRGDLKSIVIFLIFCLVLLYLVAIGVLNLNGLTQDNYSIRGFNPFPAFGPDFIVATLLFYILALVAIITSASSFFLDREEGFGITTQAKSKGDGYTKLWDKKDMKKDYGIKKIKLDEPDYEAGGFPVINDGIHAWVDDGENHSLIMGASGSGKSQCFMFPLINILAKHGESMIVTDPKGELYEGCGNLLKSKGYKLILVNFRDPDEGVAWNPFTYPYKLYKSGDIDKANELLQDLASNILVDPNNRQEPFWENTASNFFTGLALGLFDDATEREVNINSINMMAETGEDRLGASKYIIEYFKSKGELSPAYIAAASCINAPNETRGGIMSTFRTKTRIFSSQKALSEMLSYSDFDVMDIGKEKTAIFLKIHDEKTTYHALATIFVKQVYEALIAVAQTCPNIRLPFRTNFVLDEFANMPALKDVESMITASRSRNIRFSFVIQNFSQLNKVYGKEVAETIKGNCGNFVYLMSTELAALEEISKLLGDKKPEKAKKDEATPPIRPLFTVSDLQGLKQWEIIINRFRSMPFKTKLTPNFKINWGQTFEKMGYKKREHRDVEVFDLKGFVNKIKQDQGALPGGGQKNPFMPYNPMGGPIPPQGLPSSNNMFGGGMPSNLDDYVKKLDEKIAELEAEEAAEKAKNEKAKPTVEVKETTNKFNINSKEEVAKEIENIFEQKPNPITIDTTSEILEEKPIQRQVIDDNPATPELFNIIEEKTTERQKIDNNSVAPNSFDELDAKPIKIEIPSDTEKKENTHNTKTQSNEDFFDDFFGDEDI